MTRPNNSCKRDHTYCCSSNRAKIKLICQQLVAPKIEFHQTLLRKANWYSVVSPIKPNQRYILISNKWRYNDHEKRIIFQRGLLDWLLPIWTLPSVCGVHDKMQVVYKELTHDMGKIEWKVHYHMHLVPCDFFSVGLDNADKLILHSF